jgi:hypothetical protein
MQFPEKTAGIQDGSGWFRMVPDGSGWLRMVPDGSGFQKKKE